MKNSIIKVVTLVFILLSSVSANAAPTEKDVANSWAENYITSCYQVMNEYPENRACLDKILEVVYTLRKTNLPSEKGPLKED